MISNVGASGMQHCGVWAGGVNTMPSHSYSCRYRHGSATTQQPAGELVALERQPHWVNAKVLHVNIVCLCLHVREERQLFAAPANHTDEAEA
jgi:hypothetical protein